MLGLLAALGGFILALLFKRPGVNPGELILRGSALVKELDKWVLPEKIRLVYGTFFFSVFLQCMSILGILVFGFLGY